MKNAAAIEAYRHAVDINPRDYRAWYGLGQTYEILQMNYYALHYYRKASTLRPYDSRMWTALGNCFESLERYDSAIDCYERAVRHGDREGIAPHKLGMLHRKKGDDESAARYFKIYLETQGDETFAQSIGGMFSHSFSFFFPKPNTLLTFASLFQGTAWRNTFVLGVTKKIGGIQPVSNLFYV